MACKNSLLFFMFEVKFVPWYWNLAAKSSVLPKIIPKWSRLCCIKFQLILLNKKFKQNKKGALKSLKGNKVKGKNWDLPLSWGGTRAPPPVSRTLLEWGKVALGSLALGCDATLTLEPNPIIPFVSRLRDALSATAAATKDAWSFRLTKDSDGEFKSSEASGSFSKVSGFWSADDLPNALPIKLATLKSCEKLKIKIWKIN